MALDFSKLKKPDFNSLPKVNIDEMIEGLGTRAPTSGKKLPPGEALKLAPDQLGLRRTTRARKTYDLTKSKRAIAQIVTLPGPVETVHAIMGGDYDGFDVIVAVTELVAEPIDELHITTLGFNRYNMLQLCAMLDARTVRKCGILCSGYFASADAEEFCAARDALASRGQRLVATRNHSKIVLFAAGSRRYVIESSANLRSCNNLEQFTLSHSPALHAFHRRWIEQLLS